MGAKKPSWTTLSKTKNSTIYGVSWLGKDVTVSVKKTKMPSGTFYTVQEGITSEFDEDTMSEVKKRVNQAIQAPKITSELIEKIAREFSGIIRKWLTAEEMAEVLRLNQTPDYPIDGSCATHNYCDPNQAIIDACDVFCINALDFTDTTNEAWALARQNDFYKPIR